MPLSRSVLSRYRNPVVVAMAGLLLLSMGGAIVAAPLTVPLLWIAARDDETPQGLRAGAVAIAALTMAEVVWAATYLAVAEAQPWIWALPLSSGAVTAVLFARTPPPRLRTSA